MISPDVLLIAGNATPKLASDIAKNLGISLADTTVSRFSDGEINIELNTNVRGKDVFIIQSTCTPTNDNLFELLLISDALRRASAGRITAVVPYFGYARQDRRPRSRRVPISAKVAADTIVAAGVDRILTVDLHSDQLQGFFHIPVDNVYAMPLFIHDIQQQASPVTIVSPDVGGVVRARAFAKTLSAELAIIDKRRPAPNQSEVMHLIGDVEGRHAVIIDDMVDTAGTLCTAAKALKDAGAIKVSAYCSHPVLSGKAFDNLTHSMLDELVVTDSIPLNETFSALKTVRTLSMAKMLSEAIRRVSSEESISHMFSAEFVAELID